MLKFYLKIVLYHFKNTSDFQSLFIYFDLIKFFPVNNKRSILIIHKLNGINEYIVTKAEEYEWIIVKKYHPWEFFYHL